MCSEQALQMSTDFVCSQIFKFNSSYKRKKQIEANETYVSPKELAIGTRWVSRKKKIRGQLIQIPRLIQSRYQYVSILQTLQSLFSSDSFRELYFGHIDKLSNEHICQPGTYKYFCCGSTYKSIVLFQQQPESITLQLASDDFGTCNPLGSKANQNSTCAIYYVISQPSHPVYVQDKVYIPCEFMQLKRRQNEAYGLQ